MENTKVEAVSVAIFNGQWEYNVFNYSSLAPQKQENAITTVLYIQCILPPQYPMVFIFGSYDSLMIFYIQWGHSQ